MNYKTYNLEWHLCNKTVLSSIFSLQKPYKVLLLLDSTLTVKALKVAPKTSWLHQFKNEHKNYNKLIMQTLQHYMAKTSKTNWKKFLLPHLLWNNANGLNTV